ncbi:flavin reductase family protein [Vibrio rumoiensis]|uniref:Protein/domain typically associated with flavoprotein oxygenase, DIM6/NTAB family protein n=1 Tax=Vibrio rumoiensis 1S-45 TaxID=1188252 RepID=A0A1E5E0V0_9VIBR|nr:flavin reductase family protein [Vibrio rumoiensis]OEF24108.1 protein/domain typically associated with flavoprotein oxygenase, DIM6/NTAB family protein [Vibrio rumoiensis 1S-45]
MDINVAKNTEHSIYHLMTQTVIPRPVAWVLTESGDNNYNLAPFSFFTPVCSEPPLLMFSVGNKPNGSMKDTANNAMRTHKMVIHIADMTLAKQVTQTSATLEHGDSELDANHLSLTEFKDFSLPRVKGCNIALGCSLYKTDTVGDNDQTLVFAQVEHIYINDSVIDDSNQSRLIVDALKVDPLGRLGGIEYGSLGEILAVPRPV